MEIKGEKKKFSVKMNCDKCHHDFEAYSNKAVAERWRVPLQLLRKTASGKYVPRWKTLGYHRYFICPNCGHKVEWKGGFLDAEQVKHFRATK